MIFSKRGCHFDSEGHKNDKSNNTMWKRRKNQNTEIKRTLYIIHLKRIKAKL